MKCIKYPSGKDDWETFEENNQTIAVNVSYIKHMNIYPAYISKHILNHENQWVFIVWIVFILLDQETSLKLIKRYVKIKIFAVL